MSMILQISSEQIDDKAVLRANGRLDTPNAPLLERKIEALLKGGHVKVLLDLAGVDYMSSAGLRILLSASKQLHAAGGGFCIFNVQDDAMDIIKMAGFNKIIKIFDTESEALKA